MYSHAPHTLTLCFSAAKDTQPFHVRDDVTQLYGTTIFVYNANQADQRSLFFVALGGEYPHPSPKWEDDQRFKPVAPTMVCFYHLFL